EPHGRRGAEDHVEAAPRALRAGPAAGHRAAARPAAQDKAQLRVPHPGAADLLGQARRGVRGLAGMDPGRPALAEWPVGPPVHGGAAAPPTRGTRHAYRRDMKKDIHPEDVETQVTRTCGASVTSRSPATPGRSSADVRPKCH